MEPQKYLLKQRMISNTPSRGARESYVSLLREEKGRYSGEGQADEKSDEGGRRKLSTQTTERLN